MPAKYDLEGKVALITGASRGIAKSYVKTLASQGASIVVNLSASLGPANELVQAIKSKGGDAIAIQADVSSVSDIARLIEIVISNIGDLASSFVAQQAYKHITHDGGRVILTSSTSKDYSIPKNSVYAASKGAIESMVRNMAKDFGPLGDTINAVTPGGTKTDMAAESAKHYIPGGDQLSEEEILEKMAQRFSLGRVGLPQDVANLAAFLVSKEGGWVNGQAIVVAG